MAPVNHEYVDENSSNNYSLDDSGGRRSYDFIGRRDALRQDAPLPYNRGAKEDYLAMTASRGEEGAYKIAKPPKMGYESGKSSPALSMTPKTPAEFGRSIFN